MIDNYIDALGLTLFDGRDIKPFMFAWREGIPGYPPIIVFVLSVQKGNLL